MNASQSGPLRNVQNEAGPAQASASTSSSTQRPVQAPLINPFPGKNPSVIRKQLILLLHAQKCTVNSSTGVNECRLPFCKMMKNVIKHNETCQDQNACTMHYGWSSQQILSHWNSCTRPNCSVCLPVKNSPLREYVASRKNILATTVSPVTSSALPLTASSTATTAAAGGLVASRESILPIIASPNVTPVMTSALSSSVISTTTAAASRENFLPITASPNATLAASVILPPSTTSNMSEGSHNEPPVIVLPPDDVEIIDHFKPSNSCKRLKTDDNPKYESNNVPEVTPVPAIKEWQKSCTSELRNRLLQKLIHAISSKKKADTKQISGAVSTAKCVEADLFAKSDSRSEYYHLLAEKMDRDVFS